MSRFAELALTAALAASIAATPASARDPEEQAMNRTPDAQDVAMTPVTDLNLKKDEIPSVLLAAGVDPYASTGIHKCADIAAALTPLDAALGPDMDVVQPDSERVSAGSVAKSVVASFIPFRGVLRELSGAADHQREFQAAIYAGAIRRGFLKGLGQQMKCPYPSRPAFTRVGGPPPQATTKGGKDSGSADIAASEVSAVSRPVVQGEPQASPQRRR
ncbi:hypothetical protein ACWPM1_07195 [Tsuneonella sp. HG249]